MGCDKSLLELDGLPLWQRQLRLLEDLRPRDIFISGPMRPPEYLNIADARENAGPLAGLVAALRVCATPLLCALAVDLPRMSADYLRGLLELCQRDRGVAPVTDRLEPLAAIYPLAALALAEKELADGNYSLRKFLDRCVAAGLMLKQPVRPAEAGFFLNLNTPADLPATLRTR